MEKEIFDKFDKLGEKIHDKFEELDKKGVFSDIEKEMNKICSKLPEKYSCSFRFVLDVGDSEKEASLPIWEVGIGVFGQNKPYRITGGASTIHTYVINGNIRKLPHDYCPGCWNRWDFKLQNTSCPSCGILMGKEVKILLDTDICPHCEKGKISRKTPKCDKCGYEVDGTMVHWG